MLGVRGCLDGARWPGDTDRFTASRGRSTYGRNSNFQLTRSVAQFSKLRLVCAQLFLKLLARLFGHASERKVCDNMRLEFG